MRKKENSILGTAKESFARILESEQMGDIEVSVRVIPLTPEEAIGDPNRRDFPIIVGKERVIEAEIRQSKGQAFTDFPRPYRGTLRDVMDLELRTNEERAVFIASLNATLGHLGLIQGTVHCKDEDPEQCALDIAETVEKRFAANSVGLIGLNPAIAERLIDRFGASNVRLTDLSRDNVGRERWGVEVWDGATRMKDLVKDVDVVLFTGTTLVNDTFDDIWGEIQSQGKAYLVYGITAAGVCFLLDFERICPCGRDG